jgi:hypothetical protein
MTCIGVAEPTAVYISVWSPAWIPILTKSENVFVLLSKAAMKAVKDIPGINTSNFLEVRELFHLYPYIGEPLTDSDSIEKILISVAHILRFRRVAWAANANLEEFGISSQIAAWKTACKGELVSLSSDANPTECIPETWLIQQYFKHSLPRRSREISTCLERNLANPYIDHVLLLNETDALDLPTHPKLVTRTIGHRLRYLDVFVAIRELPSNTIVLFANSDIYFDETLRDLWSISLQEQRLFLALLRWEGEPATLFGPRADSQDAWIVAKETVDFEPTEEEFGFPFGKPGCDNAITLAMMRKKCLVVNPAYTIKTYHLHTSNIRNYDSHDVLYKPAYLYVDPTPIQTCRVETRLGRHEDKTHRNAWKSMQPRTSFARTLHPIHEDHGRTICTMLRQRGEGVFELNGANTWTPTTDVMPLYEWSGKAGTFVTREGLVSDFQSIYVGNHKEWKTGWEEARVSSMTPTLNVPCFLAAPSRPECWTSLSTWVLQYLPTVLRMREVLGEEGEFLVPTLDSVPPFLYDCVWNHTRVSTVPAIEDTQYYGHHVWATPPSEKYYKITREDVSRLRRLLPQRKRARRPTLVLCVGEDGIFTPGWVEEVLSCHHTALRGWKTIVVRSSDSHTKRREAFQEASWIVGSTEALKWAWMAQAGTKLLEWMLETDIQSEILHLAGAAECFYIPCLVRKESIEFQRQNALLDIGRALAKFGFSETLDATVEEKPVLVIPNAPTGIWSHAGDTFREMVALWEEKGFCTIRRSEDTPHCWWGGIGEVLLYDRPTTRWLQDDPNYQFALFGNAAPPGKGRESVWSFWPRSPRAVEEAATDIPGWDARSISSLFLGKVENGIQKGHRCSRDWSKAVEVFSMPLDSTGGPYPYSQSEYLAMLKKAKYGLCLAGYGPKCNREIEYMALGVVPIVTTGVDVTQYLVPPQEGVHYFRADTPEGVRRIVETTAQGKWEAMSNACHRWWVENASAEGFFRLTWARIEQTRPFWGIGIPPYGSEHH